MNTDVFEQTVEKISRLLEMKAGAGRGTLASQLRRADRWLTPPVRAAGAELVKAQELMSHPRLRARVDPKAVRRAERQLVIYLRELDRWDQRKGIILSVLASISAALLTSGALILVVLYWRGLI